MPAEHFGWPEAVVILSTRRDVVAGMRPEFVKQWVGPDWVTWQEGHMRIFEIARVLEESSEVFRFEDVRGDTFELRPMTLELYRKHVRENTMGKRDWDTLEELVAAMRLEW